MEIFESRHETRHLSVFILSDVHKGNANHNRPAFQQAVKHIHKTSKDRDVMVILNGDITDSINTSDKRFNPTEVDPAYKIRDLKNLAKKQADEFIEDVQPISHLIKYALIGNHEETNVKYNHFDVYDYYCDELQCEKLGYLALGKIITTASQRTHTLNICITHGRGGGGGKLIGYPLNYAEDRFRKYYVDIGIVGHIHKLIAYQTPPKVALNKSLKLINKTRWLGVAGCFLETHTEGNSGYFEGNAGEMSQLGFLEIVVDTVGDTWKYKLIDHHI